MLWLPSLLLSPLDYSSLARLARFTVSAGLFVGPADGDWIDILFPAQVWRADIGDPDVSGLVPRLVAVFFDFTFELCARTPKVSWSQHIPPVSPIPWFDAVPFPAGSLPPFPLLRESVLPLGPSPPLAVLPLAALPGGSGLRPPSWLRPALPLSSLPFPEHVSASPLLPAFRALLSTPSSLPRDVAALFLHCLEFGFGNVSPSGISSHRSEPPNSALASEHADWLRSKFLSLATPEPGKLPLAYGPFPLPPFPRLLPDGVSGPQPIGSALSIHFKGAKWKELDPFMTASDRQAPGYANCVGLGGPRLIQDASAPHLDPLPSPPLPLSTRGHGWSLNERLHFPRLSLYHVSVRTIAECLAFFGAGTVLLQTDFPAAYKNCRLSASSLFAHVSYTETAEHGKEYWVDAAEIFGSGDAPGEFDLFVVPFEHLLRRHDPLLSLIVHYVDNLFVFLPPFLLGDDPSAAASRAASSLFSFFDALPQDHHDDSHSMPAPGLGFVWSSVPSPAVAIKPARVPLVRALLALLSSSSHISCNLAVAARGLFTWMAQIMVAFAPFIAPLLELERAALRLSRSRFSVRWQRSRPRVVAIPPSARIASRVLLSRLFPHSASCPASTAPPVALSPAVPAPSPIALSPLLLPHSPIRCVIRSDASPHFGCGGYSVTERVGVHAPWDHAPHSAVADGISSTLAEAIGALVTIRLMAVPGVNVFQTDSDDLFFILSKRYSADLVLNHIIAAIYSHCLEVGAYLLPFHILRSFNRVSDGLASNKPQSVIVELLAAELGIPVSEASLSRTAYPASASSLLASVRSSLLTCSLVPY